MSPYAHKPRHKFAVLWQKHNYVDRKTYRLIKWPSGLQRIQVLGNAYWRNCDLSDVIWLEGFCKQVVLPGAGEVALTV